MSTAWRSFILKEGGSGSDWNVNPFGSSTFLEAIGVFTGETILRTRLQASIMLGMTNSSPSTTVSDPSILSATQIEMGLYCNTGATAPYVPQAADNNATDGHWLQLNEVTLHQWQVFEDSTTLYYLHGLYKFDEGTSQSFRQAGPCTADSAIYLSYFFANVFTTFWAATGPPLAGKYGVDIRASALIKV